MIEQYIGLKAYAKGLRRALRQGLVPAQVQIRNQPARASRMLIGRRIETFISVSYIPIKEQQDDEF